MNRKPSILHALNGTFRPGRHGGKQFPPPDATTPPPAPPAFLSSDAQNVWNELAPALSRLGLLNGLNTSMLGHFCCLDVTLRQAWSRGAAPSSAQIAQHRHLARDLGLIDLRLPAAGIHKNGRFSQNGRRPS
jgi:phage terminase small subunit